MVLMIKNDIIILLGIVAYFAGLNGDLARFKYMLACLHAPWLFRLLLSVISFYFLYNLQVIIITVIVSLCLWAQICFGAFSQAQNTFMPWNITSIVLLYKCSTNLLLLIFSMVFSWICVSIDWSNNGHFDSICIPIHHVFTCCNWKDICKVCSQGESAELW